MREIGSSMGLSVCFASFYFVLTFSFHLLGGIIEQPHPMYVEGHWFTFQISRSFQFASIFAVFMFICVPIDLWYQREYEPTSIADIIYFPRFNKISEWFRQPNSRWIIILVILYLAFYLADSLIEQWRIERRTGGLLWPPERISYACNLLWGAFWTADCLCRPSKGTIVAAILFIMFASIFSLPITDYARE